MLSLMLKTTISFGDAKYSDYTINKDPKRKENYINRQTNEDWNLTGVETKGFWSKNLVWNQSTFKNSVDDINKRLKHSSVKMK